MHHIYLTKAFVLSSFPFSEAGKVLNLLTKEFGVIRAQAQGIRKGNSKLRQSTQDFSLTEVALVLGKKGWILTNANIEENVFYQLKDKINNSNNSDSTNQKVFKNKIEAISRIFALVERMIPFEHDEEQGTYFFDLLKIVIVKIAESSEDQILAIETSAVYQIMNFLGYVNEESLNHEKIISDYSYVNKHKKQIIEIINNALKESHL